MTHNHSSKYLTLGLSCANFFTLGVIVAAMGPALAELAAQTSSSLVAVGGIFTAVFLGALATQVFGGPLVDRLGPRRLLPVALVLMGVGALGVTQARTLWVCLGCAAISGLGQGMVDVATHVMISGLFANRRASALNLLNVFFGAGAFSGPALAGLTLRQFHTALPAIGVGAGLGLLLALPALVWMPREPLAEGAEHPAQGSPYASPRLWWLAGLVLLYVGIENGVGGWASTYMQRTANALPETGAALTSGFWLALAVGRVAATYLGTRISAHRLLVGSLLVALTGSGLLWLTFGSLEGSTAGLLLLGFGFGPIFPTTIALTTSAFSRAAGRATSVVVALGSLGGMALPWLQGALIESSGPASTPRLVLVVGLGMLFCAFWAHRLNHGQ